MGDILSDNTANLRPPAEELEAALTAQMREQYPGAPDDHISSGVAWLTAMYTEAIAPHLSGGGAAIEPVLRQLEAAGQFRKLPDPSDHRYLSCRPSSPVWSTGLARLFQALANLPEEAARRVGITVEEWHDTKPRPDERILVVRKRWDPSSPQVFGRIGMSTNKRQNAEMLQIDFIR